jgi:hypothetical protein
MQNLYDLTGKRFNQLIVINRAENDTHGNTYWHCICDCGNKTTVRGEYLKNGATKSCGCRKRAVSLENWEKRVLADIKKYQDLNQYWW